MGSLFTHYPLGETRTLHIVRHQAILWREYGRAASRQKYQRKEPAIYDVNPEDYH